MANFASIANMGDPSSLDWQKKNLERIEAAGNAWTVNRYAAPAFQALLGDLVAAGYTPKSSGGFNYRNIRGGSKLSQHAFGNAIDIDAANNPLGSTRTNLPAGIGEIAARHNLEWGGNWKRRPDPMHFEWRGGPLDAVPASQIAAPMSVPNPASTTQTVAAAPAPGTNLLNPTPTAGQPAPMMAPLAIGTPSQVATESIPGASNLAALFVQGQRAAAQQRAEEEQAAAERKAALFGDGLFGPFA